ncbi:MAG: SRPBCC family protein [Bacteroidota bacterium]
MRFKIGTQSQINAPISTVWNIIADFPNYSSWNPTTPEMRLVQPIGATQFIFRKVQIGKLKVSMRSWLKSFEPPYEMSWGTNWIIIRYERSQTLRWIDDANTQYTTQVNMSGLLAPLLFRLLRKKLRIDHQLQVNGLKSWAEQMSPAHTPGTETDPQRPKPVIKIRPIPKTTV